MWKVLSRTVYLGIGGVGGLGMAVKCAVQAEYLWAVATALWAGIVSVDAIAWLNRRIPMPRQVVFLIIDIIGVFTAVGAVYSSGFGNLTQAVDLTVIYFALCLLYWHLLVRAAPAVARQFLRCGGLQKGDAFYLRLEWALAIALLLGFRIALCFDLLPIELAWVWYEIGLFFYLFLCFAIGPSLKAVRRHLS